MDIAFQLFLNRTLYLGFLDYMKTWISSQNPETQLKFWKIIFVKIKTTRKQTDDFAAWKKGKQRVKFSRPMSSLKKFIAKNAIQMWVAKNEKKEREENLENGKHDKFTIQINSST